MGEHYTRKYLAPIIIHKPIDNVEKFILSKVTLVEHCENIIFYLGIVGYMSQAFGVTEKNLVSGNTRAKDDILKLRMFMCWLMKRNTSMSQKLLSRMISADHTTVLYLEKSFQKSFEELNQEQQQYWLDIEEEIYDTVNSYGKIETNVTPPRKTRITILWQPNPRDKEDILKQFKEIDYDYELNQFRDYYTSIGESRADWTASFRYWLRRSTKMDTTVSRRTYKNVSKATSMAEDNDRRLRDHATRYPLDSVTAPVKTIK
jgi:hypothetical protein